MQFSTIGDFPIEFSIYTSFRIHHVFWAEEACALTYAKLIHRKEKKSEVGQLTIASIYLKDF